MLHLNFQSVNAGLAFEFSMEVSCVSLLNFFFSGIQLYVILSPLLCFISFLYLNLYVLGDDVYELYKLGIFPSNQTSMCLHPHRN